MLLSNKGPLILTSPRATKISELGLRMNPGGVKKKGLWVCLVHFAKFCKDVNMAFEVLNEVYLQNFLHRWIVNRETNLMMLINL